MLSDHQWRLAEVVTLLYGQLLKELEPVEELFDFICSSLSSPPQTVDIERTGRYRPELNDILRSNAGTVTT